jgi:hypothetical protein
MAPENGSLAGQNGMGPPAEAAPLGAPPAEGAPTDDSASQGRGSRDSQVRRTRQSTSGDGPVGRYVSAALVVRLAQLRADVLRQGPKQKKHHHRKKDAEQVSYSSLTGSHAIMTENNMGLRSSCFNGLHTMATRSRPATTLPVPDLR